MYSSVTKVLAPLSNFIIHFACTSQNILGPKQKCDDEKYNFMIFLLYYYFSLREGIQSGLFGGIL